jgi:hypothetical protein
MRCAYGPPRDMRRSPSPPSPPAQLARSVSDGRFLSALTDAIEENTRIQRQYSATLSETNRALREVSAKLDNLGDNSNDMVLGSESFQQTPQQSTILNLHSSPQRSTVLASPQQSPQRSATLESMRPCPQQSGFFCYDPRNKVFECGLQK